MKMKNIIISGLLGGLVLIVWMFLINGILGFRSQMDMKKISNEPQVYDILKENITVPGRYICNPDINTYDNFPEGEPVFSVLYSGMGHEAAGGMMVAKFLLYLLAPIIAAWLLSVSSETILSSYPKKVFFFMVIGLLIAIFSDLSSFGIGSYPFRDALFLAIHNIILWTIIGFVVGWRIKPAKNSRKT
jgi:hypothetical protein